MQLEFEHFLMTRFNVPLPWADYERTEDWLHRRIQFFEDFCLPSVVAQTNRNFKWLMFFDSESPGFLRERVLEYQRFPNLVPVFTSRFNSRICNEVVARHLEPETEWLITTRLDNDDAVCRHWVEMIQENAKRRERHWLNFTNGYAFQHGKLHRVEIPANSFISMVEECGGNQRRDIRTVYCGISHERASEIANVIDIDAAPAWVRIFHGENASGGRTVSRWFVEEMPNGWGQLSGDFSTGENSP